MESLATQLAKRILKKLPQRRGANSTISYLVLDFRKPPQSSQLGVHLADEFNEALQDKMPGIVAIERSRLRELREQERLEADIFEEQTAALWAAKTLGANLAILGTIEPTEGGFLLHVRAIRTPFEELADSGERFEWTPERRALEERRIEQLPPLRPLNDSLPAHLQGITLPKCVYCPNPSYSEEARKAKIEGTILADVLIREDGSVADVRPRNGLPYGLTSQAVATFRTWRFEPARDSDGKPVKRELTVETVFHVY